MLVLNLAVMHFVSTPEQFMTQLNGNTLVMTADLTVEVAQTADSLALDIYCNHHKLIFATDTAFSGELSANFSNCVIEVEGGGKLATTLTNSRLFDVHMIAGAELFDAIEESIFTHFSVIFVTQGNALAITIESSIFNYVVLNSSTMAELMRHCTFQSSVIPIIPESILNISVHDSYSMSAASGFYRIDSGLEIKFEQQASGNMQQYATQINFGSDISVFLVGLLPKCTSDKVASENGCLFNGCDKKCQCQYFECECSEEEDPIRHCSVFETAKGSKGAEIAGWCVFVLALCAVAVLSFVLFHEEIKQYFQNCRRKYTEEPIREVSMQEVVLQSATVANLSSELLLSEEK